MDSPDQKQGRLLPANAYTKLSPGEEYRPIVPPEDTRPEVSKWSVLLGLGMVVLWSAACIYMALKAGNGIEAAIPIAVMAIFFGKMRKVKSTILENVMVQSIGQAAGVVAAGAAFVVPALYINQLSPSWWQIFLACAIGGSLGVALIIPLRKYFVKDLHGDLPFPEATAINEIIVSGEKSGKGAGRILLMSIGLGALFDFLAETVHAWNPSLTSKTLLGSLGEKLTALRMDLNVSGIAALFGLGYIIGLKYAAIIAAGSVFACLVLVPLIFHFGSQAESFNYLGQTFHIAEMTSGQIFSEFVKPIGIGAIAVSGIIGMIRMGKIIAGSVSLGFKSLKSGKDSAAAAEEVRTQRDIDPKLALLVQLLCALLMAALFFIVSIHSDGGYGAGQSALFALVGALVGFLLSFLFTPVAAQAIATVGTNPVSGMTLITLVVAAAVMALVGLSGNAGMFIALVIGTAVCTALSTSGALITDFKIGYWIGSTPKNQEKWKFAGILLASLLIAFIIPLMDSAYHFLVADPATGAMISNTDVLPAPQANMLAAIVKGVMSSAEQPILLYALGGVVAILLWMAGVPMLAFALGMYLPLSINLAVLAGAFVSWIVANTGKTKEVKTARAEQGHLIASGLMAGAALIGIFSAVSRLPECGALIRFLSVGESFSYDPASAVPKLINQAAAWYTGLPGQLSGLIAFILLGVGCYALARLGARWEMEDNASKSDDKSAEPANETAKEHNETEEKAG